jgi:hypothetical protein
MPLAEDFARFADKLREGSNGLMSEIRFFPSGAVSMRIQFGMNRFFDLDYLPSQAMFGVDELEGDGGFNTGYRFGFHDFESAKEKMLEMLEEARVALMASTA